jgi:hypothetical protein
MWESTIFDFTTCDWEKFVDVPITCNESIKQENISEDIANFHFAEGWYITVDIKPSKCCEKFTYSWNKTKVNDKITFRKPLPTAFSLRYYHKYYNNDTKMKNTLSLCFNNGDTLSFTNKMYQRIYEHFVEIYHHGEKVFTTCI